MDGPTLDPEQPGMEIEWFIQLRSIEYVEGDDHWRYRCSRLDSLEWLQWRGNDIHRPLGPGDRRPRRRVSSYGDDRIGINRRDR